MVRDVRALELRIEIQIHPRLSLRVNSNVIRFVPPPLPPPPPLPVHPIFLSQSVIILLLRPGQHLERYGQPDCADLRGLSDSSSRILESHSA